MTAKSARQRQEECRRRRGIIPKKVIHLRTQTEVAKLLGVSRTQVDRDEKSALEKLRAVLQKGDI